METKEKEMSETLNNKEAPDNSTANVRNLSGSEKVVERKYPEMNDEEKSEMWENIADWFALPEDERKPKLQKELFSFYEIPERTFYSKTATKDYQDLITKKCLRKVKKRLPEVLKALQLKAEGGSEKSVEMFLEYVAELSKKMDLTTGGEKINQMSYEQAKAIIRREEGSDKGNLPE